MPDAPSDIFGEETADPLVADRRNGYLSERTVASGRQYFQFKPTRSTLPSNFWLAFMKSSSAAVKLLAAATE